MIPHFVVTTEILEAVAIPSTLGLLEPGELELSPPLQAVRPGKLSVIRRIIRMRMYNSIQLRAV